MPTPGTDISRAVDNASVTITFMTTSHFPQKNQKLSTHRSRNVIDMNQRSRQRVWTLEIDRAAPRKSAKRVTARFFMECMLPETAAHLARIQSGAGSITELPEEAF